MVFGYALLGSTWLIMKTDGALQNIAFALTRPLVVVVVAFMGLVSTWLPFLSSQIMARWFESGNFLWLSPVPLLALVNAVWLWRAVMRRAEYAALHPGADVLRAGLRRAGAGHLAEPVAAGPDHLEGGRAAGESGIRARRAR